MERPALNQTNPRPSRALTSLRFSASHPRAGDGVEGATSGTSERDDQDGHFSAPPAQTDEGPRALTSTFDVA